MSHPHLDSSYENAQLVQNALCLPPKETVYIERWILTGTSRSGSELLTVDSIMILIQ